MRLGSASPVSRHYRDAVDGIQKAVDVVAEMMNGAIPAPELTTRMETNIQAALGAQDRFHDAASKLIGVPAP